MKKNGFLKFILICGFVAAAAYAVVKIMAKLKERFDEADDECECECEEDEDIGCTGCCDECELCDEDEAADDEVAAVEGAEAK